MTEQCLLKELVISQYVEGLISRKRAAFILNVAERTITRYSKNKGKKKRVRRKGIHQVQTIQTPTYPKTSNL